VYDVFISYHGQEHEFAEALAADLRRFGLRVWFDQWRLRPGKVWLPELEKALKDSAAVAVLIGAAGPGPWQAVEVGSAVLRFAESGNPVIPVLLPNTSDHAVPSSLEHHTPIHYQMDGAGMASLSQLVWAITGRRPQTTVGQFGEEFTLTVPTIPYRNSTISTYTLPNPAPGSLLHLTWETFGAGVVRLIDQIKSFGGRLDVDACYGINEAGLVMATFLASAQFNRCAVGYLKCIKSRDRLLLSPDSWHPDLPDDPTIIVCDFEVKYADVIGFIARTLRERRPSLDLYFAVFGAMSEEGDLAVRTFDQLTGGRIMRDANLCSVFIAAVMSPPGIEPPLELR
jgi:hypothetical protein